MAELSDKARFNLKKASVLLFESPVYGLDITAQILAGLGVRRPDRCKTPSDATMAVKSRVFDLIICDGGVPDGGAYEFISELRRSDLDPNRYCPVILIAGHTPQSLVSWARDCGANFVLAKPISPRVMLERILWMGQGNRSFIELDTYVGPDRRFHDQEPGPNAFARRRQDLVAPAETVPTEEAQPEEPRTKEARA